MRLDGGELALSDEAPCRSRKRGSPSLNSYPLLAFIAKCLAYTEKLGNNSLQVDEEDGERPIREKEGRVKAEKSMHIVRKG